MHFHVQSLIDSLDGVCYLVEPGGAIASIGRPNWERFAEANDALDLSDTTGLLGRNLFEFIAGEAVRQTFRRFFSAVVSGGCRRVVLDYRCDSPTVARHHRVSITPLGNGKVDQLLIQNITVAEVPRPAVAIFDFETVSRHARASQLPIVAMCSYCQTVRFPADSTDETGEWVEADIYYRRGGRSAVQVSHGLCPQCFQDLDTALNQEIAAGRFGGRNSLPDAVTSHTHADKHRHGRAGGEVIADLCRGGPHRQPHPAACMPLSA